MAPASTAQNGSNWMKNHPLEGDDIVGGIYNLLTKRNPKTMKPCKNILVPDTVVYEHNFPRGWYTTDNKAREVMRKQGKELDASTIEKGFKEEVNASCPIVATYLSTCEEQLENGETETKTLVEVFNKDTIGEFLSRKTKADGILQKFFMPKGYYNSVIKAVWSPRICMVQRRTNKYAIFDKKRAENDPYSTAVTYEGPTFLSEEGCVSGNIALEVKKLCGFIVRHFYYVEHKFITRMVLYFKSDKQDKLWLLWCGSLRVSDRNANSEMPVNLITNFAEPDRTASFDEDKLLWDADQAFLRVTNDEMFYETYMKNVKLLTKGDFDGTGKEQVREIQDNEVDHAESGDRHRDEFDWTATPTLVQETYERLTSEREEMLATFTDIFYKARGHFVTHKNAPFVIEIYQHVIGVLTENGVVDLMRMLRIDPKGTEDEGLMRYIIHPSAKCPITKLLDDALEWINNFFDRKVERLQRAAINLGHDDDALREELADL